MSEKSKEIELVYSPPEKTPVSKKGYFVSPIDKSWVTKQDSDVNFYSSVIITGGMITLMASPVGGIFIPHLVESIGAWGFGGNLASFAGVILTGFSASILPIFKKFNRANKTVNYAQKFNANLIKDWLLKKYNLVVDDKSAYKLSGYVTELRYENSQEFSDSRGLEYKLDFIEVNGAKEYFVVSANAGKNDELALQASIDKLALDPSTNEVEQNEKEEPFKSPFSGEATTLHSSIVTRIQKLNTMGVDTDKQYTLNFIAEELLSVVKLHERAVALGSEESVQNQTVAVLSDLNDELDKLIISELADIEREFSIKRSHLSERKMGSNSSVKAIESLSEKESNRA